MLFSSVFPAMFGTFVKREFQRTYDAILAAPVDAEELVTAEALWIAVRAGVYGCAPMLVAMLFGLDPAWGMLLVPGHLLHHRLRLGLAPAIADRRADEVDRQLQLRDQHADHADVPRRRHVLPDRAACPSGRRSPPGSTRSTTASSSSAAPCFGFDGWVDVAHLAILLAFGLADVAAGDLGDGPPADRLAGR